MKKSGISLIVLVITIVVSAMLLSLAVIALDSNAKNASLSGFLEDLKQIEDLASASLIEGMSDNFSSVLTKDEVKALLDDTKVKEFEDELSLNSDDNENKFYKVNLSKLGIKKSNKGNMEHGEDDIYVLASNSLHAYYLKGITIKKQTYFSISKKIKETL